MKGIITFGHVAEELVEYTFVRLGNGKPVDKRLGSFMTWLYAIGRNIAINYQERRARLSEVAFDDCLELIGEEENLRKKTVHNIETLVYRARKSLRAQLEMEGFEYEELRRNNQFCYPITPLITRQQPKK